MPCILSTFDVFLAGRTHRHRGEVVNGPEQIRAMVRRLHKYGAEVIKSAAQGAYFPRATQSVVSSTISLR
jgi:hypothetical protein